MAFQCLNGPQNRMKTDFLQGLMVLGHSSILVMLDIKEEHRSAGLPLLICQPSLLCVEFLLGGVVIL